MQKHFRILIPDIIKAIVLMGDGNALLKIRDVRCHVIEG